MSSQSISGWRYIGAASSPPTYFGFPDTPGDPLGVRYAPDYGAPDDAYSPGFGAAWVALADCVLRITLDITSGGPVFFTVQIGGGTGYFADFNLTAGSGDLLDWQLGTVARGVPIKAGTVVTVSASAGGPDPTYIDFSIGMNVPTVEDVPCNCGVDTFSYGGFDPNGQIAVVPDPAPYTAGAGWTIAPGMGFDPLSNPLPPWAVASAGGFTLTQDVEFFSTEIDSVYTAQGAALIPAGQTSMLTGSPTDRRITIPPGLYSKGQAFELYGHVGTSGLTQVWPFATIGASSSFTCHKCSGPKWSVGYIGWGPRATPA